MFAEERRIKIAEIVNNGNSARVSELAITFDISESTIRRDLMELQNSGLLLRTHGGALSRNTSFEPSYYEQENEYIKEKESIGKMAADLIKDGDTVLLDSGTTVTYIPKYITAKNITILTNSVPLIWELSKYEDIEIIIIGGSIRTKTKVMVGPLAEMSIKQFCVDKVFLGANGISLQTGLTTPDILEANVKKTMLSISKEKYVVADSSKFEISSFAVVCNLLEINCIITDKNLTQNEAEEYIKHGVNILRC